MALLAPLGAQAADTAEIAVGYSSIVPETVLVRQNGWIEEALKPRGIKVKWVESLGSNKTIEFLRGKSLDIGPSSSASAFLARANGTPIKYAFGLVDPTLLPTPSKVLQELASMCRTGTLFPHLAISSQRALAGFASGCAVAIVPGSLTGYSRYWRSLIDPTLHALRTIPGLAWTPCSSSGWASTKARRSR